MNKLLERLALRWFRTLRDNGILRIGEIKMAKFLLGQSRLEMALNRAYQKSAPPTYLDELRVIIETL